MNKTTNTSKLRTKMHYFTEWWKQLYGESEGKEKKEYSQQGVDFTTDLHSMGQYIQEGRRDLFETVISIKTPKNDIIINPDDDNRWTKLLIRKNNGLCKQKNGRNNKSTCRWNVQIQKQK